MNFVGILLAIGFIYIPAGLIPIFGIIAAASTGDLNILQAIGLEIAYVSVFGGILYFGYRLIIRIDKGADKLYLGSFSFTDAEREKLAALPKKDVPESPNTTENLRKMLEKLHPVMETVELDKDFMAVWCYTGTLPRNGRGERHDDALAWTIQTVNDYLASLKPKFLKQKVAEADYDQLLSAWTVLNCYSALIKDECAAKYTVSIQRFRDYIHHVLLSRYGSPKHSELKPVKVEDNSIYIDSATLQQWMEENRLEPSFKMQCIISLPKEAPVITLHHNGVKLQDYRLQTEAIENSTEKDLRIRLRLETQGSPSGSSFPAQVVKMVSDIPEGSKETKKDACSTEAYFLVRSQVAKMVSDIPEGSKGTKKDDACSTEAYFLVRYASAKDNDSKRADTVSPASGQNKPKLNLGSFSFTEADREKLAELPKKGLPTHFNTTAPEELYALLEVLDPIINAGELRFICENILNLRSLPKEMPEKEKEEHWRFDCARMIDAVNNYLASLKPEFLKQGVADAGYDQLLNAWTMLNWCSNTIKPELTANIQHLRDYIHYVLLSRYGSPEHSELKPVKVEGTGIYIDSAILQQWLEENRSEPSFKMQCVISLPKEAPVITLYHNGVILKDYCLQTKAIENSTEKVLRIRVKLETQGSPSGSSFLAQVDNRVLGIPEGSKGTKKQDACITEAYFLVRYASAKDNDSKRADTVPSASGQNKNKLNLGSFSFTEADREKLAALPKKGVPTQVNITAPGELYELLEVLDPIIDTREVTLTCAKTLCIRPLPEKMPEKEKEEHWRFDCARMIDAVNNYLASLKPEFLKQKVAKADYDQLLSAWTVLSWCSITIKSEQTENIQNLRDYIHWVLLTCYAFEMWVSSENLDCLEHVLYNNYWKLQERIAGTPFGTLQILLDRTDSYERPVLEPVKVEGTGVYIDSAILLQWLQENRYRKPCFRKERVIPLTEKEPVITLYEDGVKTREYRLQTEGDEDFAGKYFHISVVIGLEEAPSAPIMQMSGFVSDTSDPSEWQFRRGLQDIGYRLEAHFLDCGGENAQKHRERKQGQDLIPKMLKTKGRNAPPNIRLVGICPDCGKSFCFHGYARCMVQNDVAYSDDGLDCCEVSAYEQPDNDDWKYEVDGKTFRYYNSFCCPHCGAPYIDYRKFPENKVYGVSGCVHLGRELYIKK